MSATAAGPAAVAPERAQYRRPLTLTVYRWELRKLRSQVRTYLGPALLTLLIVVFVVFEIWFLVPMPKGPLEAWLGY